MKKRLRKKKSAKAYRKYGHVFENMIEPVIQMLEKFNPSEFRTHEHQLRESVERQLQQKSNDKEFGDAFIKLFVNMDFDSAAKEAKKQLKQELKERTGSDKRFAELFNLINKIDQKYPNIPFIPLFISNPIELFVKALEPADLIEEFKKLKGERAARTLIRINREVAVLLYYDYLKAIFQLVQLLEGKPKIRNIEKFGVLADQLPNRLKKLGYSDIVDPDAGWIRNAACHGHWKYKPENNSLVLWDAKKPEKEFSIEELSEKTMKQYSMVVDNYLPLILFYLRKKAFTEWIELFKYLQRNLTALINNEPKAKQQIEKMIDKRFSALKQFEFKQIKKSRD